MPPSSVEEEMNGRSLSRWVIIVATATLLGYDVVIAVVAGAQATLSRIILTAAAANPAIAFAAGFLCGHLFWPQPPPNPESP
jgi:hypothetical protein